MNKKEPFSRTTKLTVASAFVLYSAYNLVLTALQDYILFMSGEAEALGTSFGVFTLSAVLSRLASGWILEKIDDAIALITGNLVLTIALGVYPLAPGIAAVYAIRAIQGFGWALATVTILTMIVENTDSSRASEALGYLNVFGSASLLMFPAIGSWIVAIKSIETFNVCFSSAFLISGLSTVLSIYAWRVIPPAISHEVPVSGLPERAVLTPTFSAFLLFVTLGVLLSYSPEIAALNGIQNPGIFFSVFAFAQILGSAFGGAWTGRSRYGLIAAVGALLVVAGAILLATQNGLLGYVSSAFIVGLGLAAANIALNSYVSAVSRSSEANGMAMYSAGADTAIATGSFGTALLLALGWDLSATILVFAFTALLSSFHSYLTIAGGMKRPTLNSN